MRAVALTGDPDALARALTKIHAYAHLPRRVGATHEQQASHPSLARRVKAIQSATPGRAADRHCQCDILSEPTGRLKVTFADARLEWREGDAALHSLSYSHLTELRLHARPSGPTRLLVVERSGRRWDMPLADGDAGRAQAVLDLVDGQLAEPRPQRVLADGATSVHAAGCFHRGAFRAGRHNDRCADGLGPGQRRRSSPRLAPRWLPPPDWHHASPIGPASICSSGCRSDSGASEHSCSGRRGRLAAANSRPRPRASWQRSEPLAAWFCSRLHGWSRSDSLASVGSIAVGRRRVAASVCGGARQLSRRDLPASGLSRRHSPGS